MWGVGEEGVWRERGGGCGEGEGWRSEGGGGRGVGVGDGKEEEERDEGRRDCRGGVGGKKMDGGKEGRM